MQVYSQATRLICWSYSDCQLAKRTLLDCVLLCADVETIPFQKKRKHYPFVMTVVSISGLTQDGNIATFCFPFQMGKAATSGAPGDIEWIYEAVYTILGSGIRVTGHNFAYDLIWFMRYGIVVANWAYDSMVMFWAKWPELPKRLDFVSSILLDDYQYWKADRKSQDFNTYCHYAMSDTEYTLRNTLLLAQMCLMDERMRTNFMRAMTRCMVAIAMSAKGIKANARTIQRFARELGESKDKAWAKLRYLVADPNFNPNSPTQKAQLIYGILGARKRNAKGRFVTKDSDASTGAVTLRAMRSDHPIYKRVANGILEAIEPAKQLSNVVGLEFHNGRFYTSYDGVGTTTTRLSSRGFATGHGGNAQNIRKDYRHFMEADRDSFLIDIDYSGADDVFVAFESKEQKKIDLVRSGRDIHCTNALIFFTNWSYDSLLAGKKAGDKKVVHPITGIRQITKKLCHGMSYLMAGVTLLMTAGREAIVAAAIELGYKDAGYWKQDKLIEFCAGLEEKFRNHYPRLRRTGADSWYTDLTAELVATGGITTIFGYYQRFLGDPHDESTLRAAAATSGQANTSGRINAVMDEVIHGYRITRFRDGPAPDADDRPIRLTERDHGFSLRLQTHDSLTANIRWRNPRWHEGVQGLMDVMNRPIICKGEEFRVGIEAEVSIRWAGKESVVIKTLDDIDNFLCRPIMPLG